MSDEITPQVAVYILIGSIFGLCIGAWALIRWAWLKITRML